MDVAVIAPTTSQIWAAVYAPRVSGSVRCEDSGSICRRARQTRAGNSTQHWSCACAAAKYDACLKERGPTQILAARPRFYRVDSGDCGVRANKMRVWWRAAWGDCAERHKLHALMDLLSNATTGAVELSPWPMQFSEHIYKSGGGFIQF